MGSREIASLDESIASLDESIVNATHTYLLFGEHGISNGYTFLLRVIEGSVATYLVGSSEPTLYGMGPDYAISDLRSPPLLASKK